MALPIMAGAAVGIGLYDILSGKGGDKLSIVNNITNQATITSLITSTTDCFVTQSVDDAIALPVNTNTDENSKACADQTIGCSGAVQAVIAKRASLAQKWGINAGETTVNPCQNICRSVIVQNISQQSILKSNGNCSISNNITNNIQQSMKEQLDSQVTNQEDIFGQLGSIFAGTRESINNDLSHVLSQNLQQDFVNNLTVQLADRQKITISGASIYVDGITQRLTGSVNGTLKVTNTITDQLSQSSDFSLQQTLKNINDSVGDLGKDFLSVVDSVSSIIDTLVGQLLFIIGGILVAILLIIGALFLCSKSVQSAALNWLGEKFQPADDPQTKENILSGGSSGGPGFFSILTRP